MLKILRETFGLSDFRPGQEQVIQRLLDGQSALAIFPTGAGKSLCYQLPAVMLDGLTLVVSPLIALMKDQLDALQRRGVAAARLDSSLDAEATRDVYSRLRRGDLKLLYVAPERFGNERFLQLLADVRLAMLAVDEAHCISEWGHNFRPDYMKLAALVRKLQVPRVLALTATATPEVAASIARAFDIPDSGVIRSSAHRPNLHLRMRPARSAMERDEQLLTALPDGPAIVYVTLQKTAEAVAERLRRAGRHALAYHAGLDAETRSRIQDEFMAARQAVVVATIAFGMGVDKADIRGVVHYNLPKSIENYAQEIGRAGRDGETSVCTVLAIPDDRVGLENFTFGDTPTPEALRGLLSEVLAQPDEFDVSVYDLSQRFDIRNLVVETALTYLELDGVLRSTRPFYSEYKLAWNEPEERVLQRFDAARADFLRRVFAQGTPGRKWTKLDVHKAALALNEPRDRLIRALNYLEEQGWVQTQVSGVRQGYAKMPGSHDLEQILATQQQRFAVREERDLQRLDQIQALLYGQGCTTRALLEYFGEQLQSDCGTCGVCLGEPPAARPPRKDLVLDVLPNVPHAALSHPRQLARFLCGLTSPQSTRAGLSKHSQFGVFAEVPFMQVLEAVTKAGWLSESWPGKAKTNV